MRRVAARDQTKPVSAIRLLATFWAWPVVSEIVARALGFTSSMAIPPFDVCPFVRG